MVRAVFFDLFETLITEWEKGKNVADFGTPDCDSPAAILGVSNEVFEREWNSRRTGRMTGFFSDYYAVLKDICASLNLDVDDKILRSLNEQRIAAKHKPYRHIEANVLEMLRGLKNKGLKIGLISNCSAEEVDGLFSCPLVDFIDELVLSFQVGVSKPNREIYMLACNRLEVEPAESIFIGDGGANELLGATNAGMKAYRATWFRNIVATSEKDEFRQITDPRTVLDLIDQRRAEDLIWRDRPTDRGKRTGRCSIRE